jgi:hypothetical protein
LEKIGQQVGGGGFGDIWKGLFRGQSVCVKIMRLFQNDDIQAVLKVRSPRCHTKTLAV